MSILTKIQTELKAPKGQYNSFGKYRYRSAEDILEALKPILGKYDAELTLSDDIREIGGRVYVFAHACIRWSDEGQTTYREVTALAREPESKKGMDDSQITGTASSYARKYALNGLFLIDDTKDADTDEYQERINSTWDTEGERKAAVETLKKELARLGRTEKAFMEHLGLSRWEDLTQGQYNEWHKRLAEAEK